MIALRADLKVVLATQPVDFRKSVHTLSALVSEALHANPYCGDVFVFRSKRMDRVKLLAWDGSGARTGPWRPGFPVRGAAAWCW